MENQLYKKHASRAVKQDSEKEKQAGHFQNQKQSACISRIQSNDGCDGNPNRYHSQADDRYGCICNHEFRFSGSYRFLFFALERKCKREFHHRRDKPHAGRILKEKSIENFPKFCAGSHISRRILFKLLKEIINGKFFDRSSFLFFPFWFLRFYLRRMNRISQVLVGR